MTGAVCTARDWKEALKSVKGIEKVPGEIYQKIGRGTVAGTVDFTFLAAPK